MLCAEAQRSYFKYILSTGFDVSTAVYDSSALGSEQDTLSGIAFNSDGTKMYIVSRSN